jgi:hypothetical protein
VALLRSRKHRAIYRIPFGPTSADGPSGITFIKTSVQVTRQNEFEEKPVGAARETKAGSALDRPGLATVIKHAKELMLLLGS